MTAPEEPVASGRKKHASSAGWAAGLLLLLALVLMVTQRTEERRFAELLQRAEPAWLLAAGVLQALTYVCAAAVWQRALARSGVRQPLAGLVPLGLAKLFTDQAVPSAGMSGTLLVVRALTRRGVARGLAVGAVLVALLAFYGAYVVAVSGAVAVLWSRGELDGILLGVATAFTVLAGAVAAGILVFRERAGRILPGFVRRLPVARQVVAALAESPPHAFRDPRLIVETIALQLAIFVLDAATLEAVLLAIATPVPPPVVFASFVVASAVATLGWMPGGLGTFDATCVAMLHLHGVPVEAALAGTLLLRGFTFWLPMLPGLWLSHREAVGGAGARRRRGRGV